MTVKSSRSPSSCCSPSHGCSHPIGNTIALAVYVASGVLLALPWAIEKLEPYLTESEDQQ